MMLVYEHFFVFDLGHDYEKTFGYNLKKKKKKKRRKKKKHSCPGPRRNFNKRRAKPSAASGH